MIYRKCTIQIDKAVGPSAEYKEIEAEENRQGKNI